MIQEDHDRCPEKAPKKKFRLRGPLDAYIYQDRHDEEDVKETQDNVFVHLPEPIQKEFQETSTRIHIFTDGACTNNGRRGANAAWGIVTVSDDPEHRVLYTDSGPIPKDEPQTNQRAELQALLKGLRQASLHPGHVTIWSDSQYSINCASVWGPKWRAAGWIKQGGPIQHLDLIKHLVNETAAMGHRLQYKWLKGHKEGSEYQFPWMFNHQVDAVATAALT